MSSDTPRPGLVLIAEQDDHTRMFLADNLTADGYRVLSVSTREGAIEQLGPHKIDLLVVDLNGDTLSLIDDIRRAGPLNVGPSDLPVIVLGADGGELQRVRLLERGSDDVLTKPFSYPELRARIAAVLRRTAPGQPSARLIAGDITIDPRRRLVTVAGERVGLSATEYRLLCTMATEPTRTFTRAELMRTVWGYYSNRTRTLDSHCYRLRACLSPATHAVILNVWGVGYRLLPDIAEVRSGSA